VNRIDVLYAIGVAVLVGILAVNYARFGVTVSVATSAVFAIAAIYFATRRWISRRSA
jgi:uncharacterized membrane protein